ncbi:Serine/threonine-protein kinase OSR1 [Tritrichomonas foetus]|uniref:Serine/threonine-protein kinase OSR1 n=1 Tax=Tritrichomonas foetus TaxID=1144522 RepID=A0A1J4JDH5_9EUKA|nr:Serine/threonine-protein kinase OSR1 [Tritrichomonas foetus]|eukprot:OHS97152.1 Serine/threonine-protein kinase OSR1 [Tritrichomonas foetus]
MTDENNFPLDASKYQLLHVIGSGSTSEVYAAKCITNNREVAIKLINLEAYPMEIDLLRQEVAFWSSSQHPTVVKYYNSFISGPTLYILMEYMAGGSVADIIKFAYPNGIKDENVISTILLAILQALDYIHSNKQLHRDVKPGNALVSADGSIKIGDFGVAASILINPSRFTVIGTPCYMAPEILQSDNGYTEKADIWSFGITAIELALGQAPYATMMPLQIMQKILKAPPPHLPPDSGFSAEFTSLVKSCLNFNPKRRPTASELLQNPFFQKAKDPKYIHDNVLMKLPPLEQRFPMMRHELANQIISNLTKASSTDWDFDILTDETKATTSASAPAQAAAQPTQQTGQIQNNQSTTNQAQNSNQNSSTPIQFQFQSSQAQQQQQSQQNQQQTQQQQQQQQNQQSNQQNQQAKQQQNEGEGEEVHVKGRFKVKVKKQSSLNPAPQLAVPQVFSSPLPDVSPSVSTNASSAPQQQQQSEDQARLQAMVDKLTEQVNRLVEENLEIKQEIRQLLKAVQMAPSLAKQ